jgi:PAS domain S-box-containing protein
MTTNITSRILYVEDDPQVAELTMRWLRNKAPHIQLEIVTSARQALERLKQTEKAAHYDVILVGDHPPALNGIELFKEIRRASDSNIPVALVTEQGDEEAAMRALRLGVSGYLVKRSDYLYHLRGELESIYYRTKLNREQATLYQSDARNRATLGGGASSETEERFQRLVENLDSAFLIMEGIGETLPGRVLYVSRAYEKLWGLSCESLYRDARSWLKAVHPEDRERIERVWRARSAAQLDEVFRIVRPDGEVRWVHDRVLSVHNLQGGTYQLSRTLDDITKTRRMETALRHCEERVQLAQEAGRIGAWEWDVKTSAIRWSRETFSIMGLRPFSVRPNYHLWADRIHPDDFPTMTAKMGEAIEKKKGFQCEYRIVWPDETIRWIDGRAIPIYDEAGQCIRISGFIADVTDRKLAKEARIEYDDQFRRFVEHTPAAVAMFDREMRYVLASRRWLTDYKLGEQDLVSRSHYDVFPEIPQRWKEIHQRCLAGAVETSEEERFARLDGSVDWIRWEIRPWRAVSGEIGGIIMFTEVITERKLADQALQESQKRYQTIFENVYDAILLENFDDEIVEANKRACELLGYSREQLLTMKAYDLRSPGIQGSIKGVVAHELKKYENAPIESIALSRSGREIPIEITNTLVEDRGQPYVLTIVREITERKRAEVMRQEQIRSIREAETNQHNFDRILGRSPAIQETIHFAQKVAAGDVSPVLITGETGVGKGLIARAIHYASPRAAYAFVSIDCTSIPETLFESELFGYEQGAFTDARKQKRGRLELARGGTLFLDEISEISLNLQSKLLQVIQEGIYTRIGGREEIALNARILVATNRDLRDEVAAGRFRADLFQRLYVVQLDIPPLRERRSDILVLAESFTAVYNKKYGKQISRIAPQAADLLTRYSWPGNVRELEHAIERAVFFEEGDEIRPQYLRINLDPVPQPGEPENTELHDPERPIQSVQGQSGETLEQMSALIIKQTVKQYDGNISKAARALGVSRSRIYRLLREN